MPEPMPSRSMPSKPDDVPSGLRPAALFMSTAARADDPIVIVDEEFGATPPTPTQTTTTTTAKTTAKIGQIA